MEAPEIGVYERSEIGNWFSRLEFPVSPGHTPHFKHPQISVRLSVCQSNFGIMLLRLLVMFLTEF